MVGKEENVSFNINVPKEFLAQPLTSPWLPTAEEESECYQTLIIYQAPCKLFNPPNNLCNTYYDYLHLNDEQIKAKVGHDQLGAQLGGLRL